MANTRETIIALVTDAGSRDAVIDSLHKAGLNASGFATSHEVIEAVQRSSPDLVLLDASILDQGSREILAAIRSSAASEGVRVILLVGPQPDERSAALDLGADDAISRPWDHRELVSRIRTQLRMHHAEKEMRRHIRVVEEGQQIAHTAFEALAVTEKMTSDAFSLDRRLKIGLASVFVIMAVMAGIYFVFAHSAQTETKQANKIILGLEGGLVKQQDLIAEVRKLRAVQDSATPAPIGKDELQAQATDLKSKMANASSDDLVNLRNELAETSTAPGSRGSSRKATPPRT